MEEAGVSDDLDRATLMAVLAEQQKMIAKLMERVEVLEGKRPSPQGSTSGPMDGWSNSNTSVLASTYPKSSSNSMPSQDGGSSRHSQASAPMIPRPSWESSGHPYLPPSPFYPSGRPVSMPTGAPLSAPRHPSAIAQGTENSFNSGPGQAVRGTSSSASVAGGNKSDNAARKAQVSGNTCRDQCWYEHPSSQPVEVSSTSNTPGNQPAKRNNRPCKNGSSCTRNNCWFEHPAGWNPSSTPPEPYSQQDNSTWESTDNNGGEAAPSTEADNSWGNSTNLNSWDVKPNNDWGPPVDDSWGTPVNNDWENPGQGGSKSARNDWAAPTYDNKTASGTATPQGSVAGKSKSSSKGKKASAAKQSDAERQTRRKGHKIECLAVETATTSARSPSTQLAPALPSEPIDQKLQSNDLAEVDSAPVASGVSDAPAVPDTQDTRDVLEAQDAQDVQDVQDIQGVQDTQDAQAVQDTQDVQDAQDAQVVQDTPPLQPSAPSSVLSHSDSGAPQTPFVWGDEPDVSVINFSDPPLNEGPVSSSPQDDSAPEITEDLEGRNQPVEEPLDLDKRAPSMLYKSWASVESSAADWGFDASEWVAPPGAEKKSTSRKKISTKVKGKQKEVELANSFKFQPTATGAPVGSSSNQALETESKSPAPSAESGPTPQVVHDPPQGVPDDEIPDWILDVGEDPLAALGISHTPTTEPASAPPRLAPTQPAGRPKISQLSGDNFPSLNSITPNPQPQLVKANAASKPTVRARPTGWTLIPSTETSTALGQKGAKSRNNSGKKQ